MMINKFFKLAMLVMVLAIVMAFVAMHHMAMNYLNSIENQRLIEYRTFIDQSAKTIRNLVINNQYQEFRAVLLLTGQASFIKGIALLLDGQVMFEVGASFLGAEHINHESIKKSHAMYVSELGIINGKQAKVIAQINFGKMKETTRSLNILITIILGLLSFILLLSIIIINRNRQLQLLRRIKGDMIYQLTHDMSQQLAIIQLKSDEKNYLYQTIENTTVFDQKNKADLLAEIKTIQESQSDLSRYIDNFYNQDKLEKGIIDCKLELLDLNKLIKEMIDGYRQKLQHRKIITKLVTNSQKNPIHSDKRLLRSIFSNLIHNAMKFSEHDTQITITVVDSENDYIILFEDQGRGIPQEHWRTIFNSFTKVSNRKDGMGLGLFNVRLILNLLGGEINVKKSELNVGTTFIIKIPKLNKILDKRLRSTNG